MIRTLHFSTFRIHMNPLMIQCCISKKIDTFLRNFQIVRDSNLLTYQLLKIFIRINNHFIHISLFKNVHLCHKDIFFLDKLKLI